MCHGSGDNRYGVRSGRGVVHGGGRGGVLSQGPCLLGQRVGDVSLDRLVDLRAQLGLGGRLLSQPPCVRDARGIKMVQKEGGIGNEQFEIFFANCHVLYL